MLEKRIYQYANEVVKTLQAIKGETIQSRKPGTRKIKEDIGKVIQKFDPENKKFGICASGCKDLDYESEYLYDLIWFKNSEEGKWRLQEVPLVLESEWDEDPKAIRHDFEKLLLANAPIKVLIFTYYNDIFKDLKEGIEMYEHGVPSLYILANWDESHFKIKIFSTDRYVEEISPEELTNHAQDQMSV